MMRQTGWIEKQNYRGASYLIFLICILLVLPFSSIKAQESNLSDADNLIVYGEVVTGQVNNRNPRDIYAFDALRCDFLSVRVSAIGGDLDPVLTILDETGSPILTRDDGQGTLGAVVDPLNIPRSGRYFAVVGRFGYGLGSTAGGYELLIEQVGNGSAHGCAMRYGDTVFNNISNMQSQVVYSFRAIAGDIINVRMENRSGDLDPYLMVTDINGIILQENDDVPGAGVNAQIQSLLIPADGTYYIFATRYGVEAGRSTGNFVLILEEADNSGLGNSALAPLPIRIGTTVEGEITNTDYEKYYRFEARQNDIITVRMDRISNNIDAYLVLADSNLRELTFNDDSRDSQNATISEFLITADGTYYIIATRFEREDGRTSGRYRLETQSLGNAFDEVPSDVRRISYGTSATGTIDDINPDVDFAFWGLEGDLITVSLSRGDGDLDPFVTLLAEDGRTLARDDDSGGGQNARIENFTLPATGVYFIRASRYSGVDNPGTSGSYILVLAQRSDE